MPKWRLDEARVLAAVAANDPPASADHRDDDCRVARGAGQVAGQVEWQRATRRPTTSSQVGRPCQGACAAGGGGKRELAASKRRLERSAWRASVAADDPPASADHHLCICGR